jgi:putative transposase
MRKSRFTDEQIVAILRECDRTSVAEAAKKHKVSEQTIDVCRKHFAGLAPADVKRLKALDLENAKLKRPLAERDLEVDLMREVNRRKWGAHGGVATRSARKLPRQVDSCELESSAASRQPCLGVRLRVRLLPPTISSSSV